jgi:hypothetical protein
MKDNMEIFPKELVNLNSNYKLRVVVVDGDVELKEINSEGETEQLICLDKEQATWLSKAISEAAKAL